VRNRLYRDSVTQVDTVESDRSIFADICTDFVTQEVSRSRSNIVSSIKVTNLRYFEVQYHMKAHCTLTYAYYFEIYFGDK
jgi:hypothetical protein